MTITAPTLRTLARRQRYAAFVETGTMRGETSAIAASLFPLVHTVELSDSLHRQAARKLRRYPQVICHHGSSPAVLVELLPSLPQEPVLFFLDAHSFSREQGAPPGVADGFPLWQELDVLCARPGELGDLVVVDDVHAFGRDDDWAGVTPAAILAALGETEGEVIGDTYVVQRRGS